MLHDDVFKSNSKIINSENIRPFDIDGCLITLPKATWHNTIDIQDPVTKGIIKMRPNKAMIRLLREEKHRGAFILVWSRGGYEWAANVIKALDLWDEVDQIMSKPLVYFDNEDVSNWLKDRVFIDFDTPYKD